MPHEAQSWRSLPWGSGRNCSKQARRHHTAMKSGLSMSAAVAQGQAKPLIRAPQICPAIHGDSGLELPDGGSMQVHSTAGHTMQKARCSSPDAHALRTGGTSSLVLTLSFVGLICSFMTAHSFHQRADACRIMLWAAQSGRRRSCTCTAAYPAMLGKP